MRRNKTYFSKNAINEYEVVVTEGSVDVDYIGAVCKLLDQLGIKYQMKSSHRCSRMDAVVVYCDEITWNVVEAYLIELEEMWYGV